MWPFKKKKEEQKQELSVIPEIPHQHVWKDMPWYMNVWYSGKSKTASYEIIEPYICITCGERKNVRLESDNWTNITSQEREKIYSQIRNRYKKYLKPRAVVEDMINNILLVKDPDYLDMIEEMRGSPHRKCGTSAEMEREDNGLKIELEETEK